MPFYIYKNSIGCVCSWISKKKLASELLQAVCNFEHDWRMD